APRGRAGVWVGRAAGRSPPVQGSNPIRLYFRARERVYLNSPRRFPTAEKRQANNQRLELALILADGTTYPLKGKVYFADRQVDVRTGAIRIAGVFPNPGSSLRPGQYGRIRTATQVQTDALLVPQQAVFDLQGTHQLAVVDNSNRVTIRAATLGVTVGNQWIVRDGVNAGDRVIVEGLQKVRTGMIVDPKPFHVR